jgi:hypothetical protein
LGIVLGLGGLRGSGTRAGFAEGRAGLGGVDEGLDLGFFVGVRG